MYQTLLAQAPAAPATPSAGGGLGGFLVPMMLIFVMMYFVMIRPQRRRQMEQQKMMTALKTGDRVVTNAGIHGLISNVKDSTVILKVADNVKIEMEKSAITTIFKPEAAKP
jgi:preprotein translocase subunit YajC